MTRISYISTNKLSRSAHYKRMQKLKSTLNKNTINIHTDSVHNNSFKLSSEPQLELPCLLQEIPQISVEIPSTSYQSLVCPINQTIDHQSLISENEHFKNKLAKFFVESQIGRHKATELLNLLKEVNDIKILSSLPLDCRTLLNCPKSINTISIGDGHYIHFGSLNGLIYLLKFYPSIKFTSLLEIWILVDGLLIRNKQFWVITCGLCINNKVVPFIVGAHCGKTKPSCLNSYLWPIVSELIDILNYGFKVNEYLTLPVKLLGFIADVPARAYIKCIKYHTGYNACEKCEEEGEYLEGRMCLVQHCFELKKILKIKNSLNTI